MKSKNKFGIIILLLFALSFVLTSCNFPLYLDTYSASGNVTDPEGNPIENVVIKFTNGYDPVTTGSNGNWSKTGLGGTVIVTAQKSGFNFSPAEYTVTEKEKYLDFESSELVSPKYTVSGEVVDNDANGLAAIKLIFTKNGEEVWTAFTDNEGNFTVENKLSGTVTITPQDTSYTFEPSSLEVSEETTDIIFRGN